MRRVSCARVLPLALLLVTLAAVPADAGAGGAGAGAGVGAGASAVGTVDAVRGEAARAVRAHETARARVDRLRAADALPTKIKTAERRRKKIRADLWDMLWAAGRASGDPVAVNKSGRGGKCAFQSRSKKKSKSKSKAKTSPKAKAPKAPKALKALKALKAPKAKQDKAAAEKKARDTARSWTAPTRDYWLSAGYAASGARWAHRHTGQDFAVSTGTPVYAVGPGTVRATTCGDGFGNQVVVRHPDGYFTQYAHLSRIDVRAGKRVKAGQRLGLSGATGNVTGPHLHFEVRITPYLGSSVPPLPWLRRKDVRVVR
ncbi:M23 family metallopeptidase [Streptomyces antibioticus]|uniref:M23 family metallopeptidase n=1 Tax=Streptomyces antibioticus TaxID=1890 RepID=UPI0022590560|nr:M23 family metallopeptidase [Streptomyces antibioticus]MCX4737854.1 M23 family metallopeptidase [Streptomyces antibioticus]